jgi:enoyl-CoA hydratase
MAGSAESGSRSGDDALVIERHGPVGWLIFNRPDAGNAMNAEMLSDLEAAWQELDSDPEVRVIVNTGTGRAFQTGLDMVELARSPEALREQSRRTKRAELRLTAWHNRVWKPVIAAVNGVCAGGGLHFVADADIVLASPNASFMDTHVNVGMVGGVENTALAYRLPLGSVMRMTLMGKDYRMSATRAYELGLVDELVEQDQLMKSAWEMATVIAANSPAAVQRSKQAILQSREVGYGHATEYGWAMVRMHWAHPDFREGPAAFREKRPPNWADK